MNNKAKVLALLVAGLTLLSAVGCSKSGDAGSESQSSSHWNDPYYSGEPATSPSNPGDGTNQTQPVEQETLEPAPEFAEVNMTLYVFVANGNVRSKTETVLSEAAICGYVREGDTLKATGESREWYRVLYNGKTCYVRKSIVCDNALITAFTEVREEIEISENVYVRSLPKVVSDSLSIRGSLKKGAKVTRTGKGDGWSRIEYTYTYTGSDGKEVSEKRAYYISNDCISSTVTPDTATEASSTTKA